MKLSTQQKKILLALFCINDEYSHHQDKQNSPIYSILKRIEPEKIKKHFYKNNEYIDKTRYASYHRSLQDLCEKGLVSLTKITSSKKKGWIHYKLTKAGIQEIDNIIIKILTKYQKIAPFLDLINEKGWKYETSFDKIYILYGIDKFKGYGEIYHVIEVFNSFKKAIYYIEDLEADKENYHCWNCDYEKDNDNIEFTDKYFKDKKCPNCGSKMEFSYTYNWLMICERVLNQGSSFFGGYYEHKYSYKKKQIKDRFDSDSEFSYREANTRIL